MAFTFVVLASLVAMASAGVPAARYPAGVNPAACPNYPYCDPLVDPRGHGYAAVPYAGYYAGYAAARPYAGVALSIGAGAKYPAGVNPAECPNFPYCHDGLHGNHAVGTYKSAHLGIAPVHAVAHGHGYAARYPAGVNPAACPNYPFCHNGIHGNHGVIGHY